MVSSDNIGQTMNTISEIEEIKDLKENAGLIEEYMKVLPQKALSLGIRVVITLIVIFVGVQLIKLLVKFINKALDKAKVEKGVVQFLDSLIRTVLYIVLALSVAVKFGVDAASVVAILGSVGLTIGIALQGALSNFVGGIFILITKPFKVGDYIMDASGNEGTVSDISIIYTKIKTVENCVIVVPNGTLANSAVVNYTASRKRQYNLRVGIDYNSDIKKARDIILDILNSEPDIIQTDDKSVFVHEFGESAIILGVRAWVKTSNYWPVKWKINERIKIEFDKNNIIIPYKHVDVHIENSYKA